MNEEIEIVTLGWVLAQINILQNVLVAQCITNVEEITLKDLPWLVKQERDYINTIGTFRRGIDRHKMRYHWLKRPVVRKFFGEAISGKGDR